MVGPFSRDFLPLGFGCAWLAGGRQTSRSLRLVETAYDAGIRYFDVARMYMSGEAEGVLGNFLPQHRNDVIVTSKAGILPPSGGNMRRWRRRAVRLAGLVLGTPMPQESHYRFGMFDTPSLKKSVEASLSALRTDHLDALLLHEVDEPDLADGKVMALLETLRAEGKIGSFGIASTRAQTQRLIPGYGGHVPIVQIASTVLEDGLTPLGDRSRFFTITHTVLAGALEKIMRQLSADAAFREQWTALTGVDPANRESVAELLLAEALDANKGGIVLFSTTSPARIAAAARVARERPYTQDQIAGLRTIAVRMKIYKGGDNLAPGEQTGIIDTKPRFDGERFEVRGAGGQKIGMTTLPTSHDFLRSGRRIARDTVRSWLLPWRKSVHIYRPGGLGDVLMCTPGLRALRQANPRCRIHFYTNYPEAVRNLPYIDEILPADHCPPKRMWMYYIDMARPRRHLAKIMGARIGVRVKDVRPDCAVDEKHVRRFREAWRGLPHPHILVQRRANNWTPNKDWPDDYWKTLIQSLLKTAAVIEIGEADTGSAQIARPHYIDLRGQTSIEELIASVAAADILVGPDSGPVHIAAAVRTPAVVVLGGYILPENTAYPENRILYTPIHCSPCWLITPCPIDRECLRRIAPETVEKAVKELWEKVKSKNENSRAIAS